jgi:hypothetical protein
LPIFVRTGRIQSATAQVDHGGKNHGETLP